MKKFTCGLKYLSHGIAGVLNSLKLPYINMAAWKVTVLEVVFFFTKKYNADLCTKTLKWVLR